MAAQMGFYIAWLLAGGVMDFEKKCVVKKPDKQILFTLEENLVFSASDLQKKAFDLYKKYGKNQVIIYDEGRQGLDSARAMENVNKGMTDFFQECGFMGHVILIVLPNFFKLHEDYAVARSIFLVDVFAKGIDRGYFNFYNENQKEWLFHLGKKRIGISAKYTSANPSFWGRYGLWLPFNKERYEELKKLGLEKKREGAFERRGRFHRDFLVWVLKKEFKVNFREIARKYKKIMDFDISHDIIREGYERIEKILIEKDKNPDYHI